MPLPPFDVGDAELVAAAVLGVLLTDPLALTRLPGSTRRTPTRPVMGETIRHQLRFTSAAATWPLSSSTVPSSCFTRAACVASTWAETAFCASRVLYR